ncbi:hypothetical protein ACHAW6_002788 [Cyclotella cf. meneghiniana]
MNVQMETAATPKLTHLSLTGDTTSSLGMYRPATSEEKEIAGLWGYNSSGIGLPGVDASGTIAAIILVGVDVPLNLMQEMKDASALQKLWWQGYHFIGCIHVYVDCSTLSKNGIIKKSSQMLHI